MAGMIGACTADAPPVVGAPIAITVVHAKAQALSSVRACIQGGEGATPVCVTMATSPRGRSDDYQPSRVTDVEIALRSTGPFARWSERQLQYIDDPLLHLLSIAPSWRAGSTRGPEDFVEVRLPFGYRRNRDLCDAVGDASLDIAEISDTAVFTFSDYRSKDLRIERAECAGGDINGG